MVAPTLESATRVTSVSLADAYRRVRSFTERLCEPLQTEDYVVQSMPDCSPTKWHLAHVSWFFETFLLTPHVRDYRSLHPQYTYLFNSYYNAIGERHCRPKRGLISRPTVRETYEYRAYVDRAVLHMLEQADERLLGTIAPILVLGLHHEQQHQELMLTDLKHVLGENPLHPTYVPRSADEVSAVPPVGWRSYAGGVHWIGMDQGEDFAFDNEGPRHQQFIQPFKLATRPVTSGEFLAFMADGAYDDPELWLSAGWATSQDNAWQAPLYWERHDDRWFCMTLAGFRPVNEAEPVCHISYFEADAYARWADARLPTEAEWELAADDVVMRGNFVESGRYHPAPLRTAVTSEPLERMFGDVWEWTQSAYSPYPSFRPAAGAIGEYNGKFMCNQYVLRGGSCATSESHIRSTYRNFFPPDARWQFSGVRLARDAD